MHRASTGRTLPWPRAGRHRPASPRRRRWPARPPRRRPRPRAWRRGRPRIAGQNRRCCGRDERASWLLTGFWGPGLAHQAPAQWRGGEAASTLGPGRSPPASSWQKRNAWPWDATSPLPFSLQPRPQLIRPQISQLAFKAFDVEADGAALGKQQQRAPAGGILAVEFNADEVQDSVRRVEVDVARLAGEHAVETEGGHQPARLGLAVQRLLPVQPAHADDQPLFALPPDPDDVRGL